MGKASKKGGLTKKHWFGYMFGDWGGCMTFSLMGSIFTMYCTDCLGINETLLGTLVLIWTIWDAVNDPMMGAIMDKVFIKHANKNGKFRPWLLRATPLLAVTFIADRSTSGKDLWMIFVLEKSGSINPTGITCAANIAPRICSNHNAQHIR